MKKTYYVILLFLFVNNLFAQYTANDSTRLSLITCSPGKEVYEQFGHTAIRLVDPKTDTDLMFNYGMFNFNAPNFLARFIKGETDYQLGVYDSRYFFPEYFERNSSVTEQELNLTVSEKQRLIDALMANYLPQNRTYLYNFVFDNCATRPRVMIENALDSDKIVYSEKVTEYYTFRHWVGKYVGFYTWTKFGIDLLFGKDADMIATKMEATFLPEVLENEFAEAKLKSDSGTYRPLIKKTWFDVEKRPEPAVAVSFLHKPAVVTLIILLIGLLLTYFEFIKKKNFKLIDTLLFITTGLAGLIVFYMMFFSIHPLVKHNFNIMWLLPINFFLAILLWFNWFKKPMYYLQILNVICFTGALVVFFFNIQQINAAAVPIILLLLVRSSFWIFKAKTYLK